MPKCDFNKVALLCSSLSPVNLLHTFRTPFLKNTSGRLLLKKGGEIFSCHKYFSIGQK